MSDPKRVFIFGAGFSKPAGMPLANEILPLIANNPNNIDMNTWLKSLRDRLAWLSGDPQAEESFDLNIEKLFHYAHFDIELHLLKHQIPHIGPSDAPWSHQRRANQIKNWLRKLEDRLCDMIFEKENNSNLTTIARWAEFVRNDDAVLTFNYDTLVERALSDLNMPWEHGFRDDTNIPVLKMHGSIDWIIARPHEIPRNDRFIILEEHTNDSFIIRCTTRKQLGEILKSRHVFSRRIGIAGLGAYKELHRIPGLGLVWARGMRSLYQADLAIIIGFSLSDFDTMAQLQFAEVARKRQDENQPLRVIVINPTMSPQDKDRFVRVFRQAKFIEEKHENFDWSSLDSIWKNI